jgi:uncharacterized DUF497 family protein
MSLGFQWDLRKAAVNETKHGVAFARGHRVRSCSVLSFRVGVAHSEIPAD